MSRTNYSNSADSATHPSTNTIPDFSNDKPSFPAPSPQRSYSYHHLKSVSWHSASTGLEVCNEEPFPETMMHEHDNHLPLNDENNSFPEFEKRLSDRKYSCTSNMSSTSSQMTSASSRNPNRNSWHESRPSRSTTSHKRTNSSIHIGTHGMSGSFSISSSPTRPLLRTSTPPIVSTSPGGSTITTSVASQRRQRSRPPASAPSHSQNNVATAPPPFNEYKFPLRNNTNLSSFASHTSARRNSLNSCSDSASQNPHLFSDSEEATSTSASSTSSPLILEDDQLASLNCSTSSAPNPHTSYSSNYSLSSTNDSSPYIISVSKPSLQEIFIALANKERQLLEARESFASAQCELDNFKEQWSHVLNVDSLSCSPRNSWYTNPTSIDSPPSSPRSGRPGILPPIADFLPNPSERGIDEDGTKKVASNTESALEDVVGPSMSPRANISSLFHDVPMGTVEAIEICRVRPDKIRKFPVHATFVPGINCARLVESDIRYEIRVQTSAKDPNLIALLQNFVLSIIELIMGVPHVAVKTVVNLLVDADQPRNLHPRVVRAERLSATEHCWP